MRRALSQTKNTHVRSTSKDETMQSDISESLRRLIEEGRFDSRMKSFLQKSRIATWYAETSQTEGKEIAEERLAEAVEFRSAFANSLAPTAQAFAALAEAQPKLVYDISESDVKTQSRIDPRYGMPHKFVAFNPDMQDGSSLGGLPLCAVVLEVGRCFEHPGSIPRTVATLVFSRPSVGVRSVGDGLAFVHYDQTGPNVVFHMERYPYVERAGIKRPFNDTKAFLSFMLGMNTPDPTLNTTGQDASIADVLGGIEKQRALVNALPHLPGYLTRQLSCSL